MTDANCPTDEELRRVAHATDSATIDTQLVAHLDRCSACRRRLESLTQGSDIEGTSWSELAIAPPNSANLLATIDALSSRKTAAGLARSKRHSDLEPWIAASSTDGVPTLDNFILLECVGRGGMGIVFRALEPVRNRIVALKAMLPELARDDRSRARFLREARAIAAVRHPNVVALHSVSEIDGLPYLTMEFIEGASLEELMIGGQRMPPDEIIRIGAAVAAGLAACHERGVVHRDIKPSNVLLNSADGSIKITDFGLAAVASTPTLTQSGYLSGTPDYVAPERLTIGSETDERSDLFSLGCLLYTMAAGEAPFGGETPLITLHRIATENPTSLRQRNPQAPSELVKTIAALMAKSPQHRPSSANEARQMLLGESTARARQASAVSRWVTRGAVLVAAAVLIAFSIAPEQTESLDPLVVRTAEELASAIEAAPDGGRVQVDTDGLLSLRPCKIVGKSLTVEAKSGRKPSIALRFDEGDPSPDYLIQVSNGELRLVGIHLRDELFEGSHTDVTIEDLVEQESFTLLSVERSTLAAERCRFATRTHGSCIKLSAAPQVSLNECFLVARSGTAISWDARNGDRLSIEDCASASVSAIIATIGGNAALEWRGTTTLVDIAAIELTNTGGRLTASVSDCVIQSQDSLIAATLDRPSKPAFQRLLSWQGEHNRIRGQDVQFADDVKSPDWALHISEWATSDVESTYNKKLFTASRRVVTEWIASGRPIHRLLVTETL